MAVALAGLSDQANPEDAVVAVRGPNYPDKPPEVLEAVVAVLAGLSDQANLEDAVVVVKGPNCPDKPP